jgi:hypothetical protein
MNVTKITTRYLHFKWLESLAIISVLINYKKAGQIHYINIFDRQGTRNKFRIAGKGNFSVTKALLPESVLDILSVKIVVERRIS